MRQGSGEREKESREEQKQGEEEEKFNLFPTVSLLPRSLKACKATTSDL
jgi:hypothetical protein